MTVNMGVIPDFEVEGGNKKSMQKMLVKKRSTVISIHTKSNNQYLNANFRGGGGLELGGISPFTPV